MKKTELLSPAGNFDCLKAAVNNGADAVYLGGNSFSARAFADNFSDDEIVEAIKYAHLRNVKVYITLNTLLTETELENAYVKAKFYYENNVDAILVQDLGLFYRLRKDFPDLELHASTQMHIHNLQGVKNAKKLGFKRVVIARESDHELIKECCKQGIEVETFVHGAICVSYSGQCLMSSVTKGRSANKGMCAQCCRLKYRLYKDGKQVKTDTEYLLSPKDMCLANDVPELIKDGVSSFKIEGRMKSPAYVGYVTRIYREAIDAYYSGEEYILSKEKLNNMRLLFNRGFTNSYYQNDNSNIFNNSRPNHIGVEIGEVVRINGNHVFIKLNKDINQFDGIRVINKINDTGLILNMLIVDGLLVNSAKPSQIIEIELNDKVEIGDIVVKTLDYKLEKEISEIPEKKIQINLNIKALPNSNMVVKAKVDDKEFVYDSKVIVDHAIKQPINKQNIIDSFKSVDDHPYHISDINIEIDNSFISLKVINDIRRDFYDELDRFRLLRDKNDYTTLDINCPINELNQQNNIEMSELGKLNPVINHDSIYNCDNNLVSEFGGLLLEGNKNAYYTLNVCNSYAFEFLLKLGFKNVVLSSELNDNQVELLTKAFKERTGKNNLPYCLVDSKRVLMRLKRNPFNEFVSDLNNTKLSDGNNIYLVENEDNYTVIKELDSSINLTKNSKYYLNIIEK